MDHGFIKNYNQQLKGNIMEKVIEIPVFGMNCEHCSKAVSNALDANRAVSGVQVSLEDKKVSIVYDDKLAGPEDFKSIITGEGYTLTE